MTVHRFYGSTTRNMVKGHIDRVDPLIGPLNDMLDSEVDLETHHTSLASFHVGVTTCPQHHSALNPYFSSKMKLETGRDGVLPPSPTSHRGYTASGELSGTRPRLFLYFSYKSSEPKTSKEFVTK